MIDASQVKLEAEQEIREEQMKRAKAQIKDVLRKLNAAKQAVLNIERELADAYAELGKNIS